jgi:hypothetical protein
MRHAIGGYRPHHPGAAFRKIPRQGDGKDTRLTARREESRLCAIKLGWLDEVVRPEGDVHYLFPITVEVSER